MENNSGSIQKTLETLIGVEAASHLLREAGLTVNNVDSADIDASASQPSDSSTINELNDANQQQKPKLINSKERHHFSHNIHK